MIFSTLYTTLPHNLIKEKLLDLIERTFYKKEGELYLACNDKKAFFTSKDHYKGYQLWSCQNVCDALSFLLDNIYIRFGTKLYRQIVGIPMGTNCAPLVADLFLFCYERVFMKNLSSDNQVDVIKAFNSTSRYLDDLNIDNPYFEGMVNQIYPSELQLNKANTSDTEAPFLAHLSRRLIGELIVYQWSGVRRRRPSSVHNAQTSSSQKPLGRSKPNFMWSLLG